MSERKKAFIHDKGPRGRLTATFAVVVGLLGVWTGGADLLVPIAASSWPDGAVGGAPKERLVRIARGELASVHDAVASRRAARLVLNVDAEFELGVAVERTSPTRWGYSLSGRIDDPTVGFVTLVVHDEAVAGAIWTPEASYEVVHLGGGVHTVREVASDVHQCGGAVALSDARPFGGPENTPAGDDDTVVDVLVVWTPRREEAAGGADSVRASIELGIAYTNDAFERSGAFVSLNLVGAEPAPDYEEPEGADALDGISTDLIRLADPSDGHMDAVHGRRDELGADLVSLATHQNGGIAYSPGAFSVWGRDPWIVAHEFGHNFGLSHERSQWGSSFRTYPNHYEHGYATLGDSQCKHTIVAYGSPCRGRPKRDVPFFSSPALYDAVDGDRLGMSRFSGRRGTDGPADAVLHLNRVRNTVAGFKPRRSPRSD